VVAAIVAAVDALWPRVSRVADPVLADPARWRFSHRRSAATPATRRERCW